MGKGHEASHLVQQQVWVIQCNPLTQRSVHLLVVEEEGCRKDEPFSSGVWSSTAGGGQAGKGGEEEQ